ncbi:S-methyl-5-thioribose-1-phosphate isomerase [Bacteroidota bacterium]
MLVNGKHYRSIWVKDNDKRVIQTIDQSKLPHYFEIIDLKTTNNVIHAIKDMTLRGAPLIGVAASYGIYLAALEAKSETNDIQSYEIFVNTKANELKSTRPTAVNLLWGIDQTLGAIAKYNTIDEKINASFNCANKLANDDIKSCRKIGGSGLKIIEDIKKSKSSDVVNILTHCNAGWLACIDYGTATSPIYTAHEKGIKVHVWVEETRPRNQGASLTAWEFGQTGIPHTIITDNAGGYVMQKDLVDLVIVGSDRTTCTGDVCNKIGTYKTALAAKDNNIPFYAALPSSSIDWTLKDGLNEIPIEERDAEEVKFIQGKYKDEIVKVLLTPKNSPAKNFGFDITPSSLVTGIITERGICDANEKSIRELFPEK